MPFYQNMIGISNKIVYNIVLCNYGSGIMAITNEIRKIYTDIIEVPVIIRHNQGENKEEWIPAFDIWSTKIDGDTSYIECTQRFRTKAKKYATNNIDSRIGYLDNDVLYIHWKALIDTSSIEYINKKYNGKLIVRDWQRRYCNYLSTSNKMPWIHAVVLDYLDIDKYIAEGYVVHHVNGVSVDNRSKNLHILPKREHDSINHPQLDERRKMFANPQEYWRKRKVLAIQAFIKFLTFATNEEKIEYIARFAKENMSLAKEILEVAKLYINLSSVKYKPSKNRVINPHLNPHYLDTYEMEKYLKGNASYTDVKQLTLF